MCDVTDMMRDTISRKQTEKNLHGMQGKGRRFSCGTAESGNRCGWLKINALRRFRNSAFRRQIDVGRDLFGMKVGPKGFGLFSISFSVERSILLNINRL